MRDATFGRKTENNTKNRNRPGSRARQLTDTKGTAPKRQNAWLSTHLRSYAKICNEGQLEAITLGLLADITTTIPSSTKENSAPNPSSKRGILCSVGGGGGKHDVRHPLTTRVTGCSTRIFLVKGDEVAALLRDALVQTLLREPRLAEQSALVPGSPIAQHRNWRETPMETNNGGARWSGVGGLYAHLAKTNHGCVCYLAACG